MLSVIIPTFNTAQLTLHCCRAAVDAVQRLDGAEIIVVDDASQDGTADLIEHELPEVRVVRRRTNGGFAAAANEGVRAATGDLLLLLNSDTVVAPDALAELVAAFTADRSLGIASAQLFDEDGTPQWTGGRTPTLLWMLGAVSGKGHLMKHLRFGTASQAIDPDWVSGAAMAFRREVWDVAGPLEERYRFYCQDIDFCLDARKHGWRVAIVPAARVTHVRGATIGRSRSLLRDDLVEFGRARYGRLWAWLARAVLHIASL